MLMRTIMLCAGVTALLGTPMPTWAESLPWGESARPQTITPYGNGQSAYDRYGSDRIDDRPLPAPRSYDQRPYPPARPYTEDAPRDYARDRVPDYRSEPYKAPPPRPYQEPRYGTKDYGPNDYGPRDYSDKGGYAEPYRPPAKPYAGKRYVPERYRGPYRGDQYAQQQPYDNGYRVPPPYREPRRNEGYSPGEIRDAGHRFFGKISQGLASVIEYAFQRGGRPNGYILGQEGGGAFVAGLRYGEGTLYTKYAGNHPVYWQGPSIGYDFGAEGSKTMTLVYNLRDPSDIYQNFGGVDGSAYVVGGVGITYQQNGNVVLAPIRSGIGLRLGANIGYLKYTRRPTWNPF